MGDGFESGGGGGGTGVVDVDSEVCESPEGEKVAEDGEEGDDCGYNTVIVTQHSD